MSEEITAQSIDERIESLALEIMEEYEDRDSATNGVWETVDELDWIIYTYMARSVVQCLDLNEEGEAFDRMGEMGFEFGKEGIDSMSDIYTKLVFFHMESKVCEIVHGLWDKREEFDTIIEDAIDEGEAVKDAQGWQFVAFFPEDISTRTSDDGFCGLGATEDEAREDCRKQVASCLRSILGMPAAQ